MADFSAILCKYQNVDFADMGNRQLKELEKSFKSVCPEDINTLTEHKDYIELLTKFRSAIAENDKLHGENYPKTLSSLLSVGADGLYTNDLRFLFELIQNVDDCLYDDPTNCRLDIQFDTNRGCIVLKYNEKGFRPFDVFSITGIAEAAKNISPDKIEIGEKGIGFKSVFGVADKVLIQSGKFSFMLYKDNFTVPEPHYENFNGVNGTKLTLYVKTSAKDDVTAVKQRGEQCHKIYREIVDAYCKKEALFCKNPILFLNKLTGLRFYIDSFRSLEFKVSRTIPNGNIENKAVPEGNTTSQFESLRSFTNSTAVPNEMVDDSLTVEDDIKIAAVLKDHYNGRDKHIENKISCIRYTLPITYNREMCVSRYGEDTKFNSKRMLLQVVVQDILSDVLSDSRIDSGALYSFLPTQVKTTVPVACHIPFKLDSSREFIGHQDNSLWFQHSCKEFGRLLEMVYLDLAKRMKSKIVTFLPKKSENFFDVNTGNDKVRCLGREEFIGQKYVSLPVFYTGNETYKSCDSVKSFSPAEEIADTEKMAKLLRLEGSLFVAPEKENVAQYGISIYKDAHLNLFKKGFSDNAILPEALDIIDATEFQYSDLIAKTGVDKLSLDALYTVSKHTKCLKAFNEISIRAINKNSVPPFTISNAEQAEDIRYIISKDEPIDSNDLGDSSGRYLKNREYKYFQLDIGEKQYFIADNGLAVSRISPMDSFAHFCYEVDKNNLFAANMIMRAASLRLNQADESMPVAEYMKLLKEVRSSIKQAFGKSQYESYIKVIREVGTDSNRFLHELLQNADDCTYPDGAKAYFKLTTDKNTLTTEYNETGFTKANVRSITAIGESTKRQIREGQADQIGEKGIGFKSVFGVADDVTIYSNEFFFKLSADEPTIPKNVAKPVENVEGTRMVFNLRNSLNTRVLSKENALSLCLCLRNLKHVTIDSTIIEIEDEGGCRFITINGTKYKFRVITKTFEVTDEAVLKERSHGGREYDKTQKISIYIPEKSVTGFEYSLYCGLPTAEQIGVDFCIDAPFELTSARDRVLENAWNEMVRKEMYLAYADMLEVLVRDIRIKVMDYLRFESLDFGRTIKFSLFKGSDWLNSYGVVPLLQRRKIVPTYDKDFFAVPAEVNCYRYPKPAHALLCGSKKYANSQKVIDNQNDDYDSILKNLGCQPASLSVIAALIMEEASYHMSDAKFRKDLYKYLVETREMHGRNELKNARIIPVKKRLSTGDEEFIAWNGNRIYVDDTLSTSPVDFWLLDTKSLPKNELEIMLSVNVTVMDERYKRSFYEDKLKGFFTQGWTDKQLYESIKHEYDRNREQLSASKGTLSLYRAMIPLKLENGDYGKGNVFLSNSPGGYYNGIIKRHVIAKEAKELAAFIGDYKDINQVTYEDLDIKQNLTADDIEDLQDSTIRYGRAILELCMFDGFISEELIEAYNLSGLRRADYSDTFGDEDFPNEPVRNISSLRNKISSDCRNARKIVKEQELRTVDKIQLPNGQKQLLNDASVRAQTIKRYRPASNPDVCFCQMCRNAKGDNYIEVNNLIPAPQFYWSQLRIALCLECSKQFEDLRRNPDYLEEFEEEIRTANVMSSEPLDISIGNKTIRFTQTHLAEIQEILKSGKK